MQICIVFWSHGVAKTKYSLPVGIKMNILLWLISCFALLIYLYKSKSIYPSSALRGALSI